METERLNPDALSGRQLSVAVLVGGLSPAAALAGRAAWPWLLLWAGVGVALGWLTLRRLGGRPLYQGAGGGVLAVLCGGWAVVLAARVLRRAAERIQLTSGGEQTVLWLILLLAIPLVWMGWGKAAPFFRMAEILWLAMAVTLALILTFGAARVEWRYVVPAEGGWLDAALVMGEILTPGLFVLPYIYKVREPEQSGQGLAWLAGLGGLGTAMSVITVGILGGTVPEVTRPFFVAAGLLGSSSRCEGLLSALWVLPDLTLAGLLCRVWGARRWPAAAAVLTAALAASGITDLIPNFIFPCGTLFLLALTLVFPKGKGKIVVPF
ncbi:MAG: hypothetical protein ACI4OU_06465 [Candidatus Enterenecus sp.]